MIPTKGTLVNLILFYYDQLRVNDVLYNNVS